jgi:hypothetical protein
MLAMVGGMVETHQVASQTAGAAAERVVIPAMGAMVELTITAARLDPVAVVAAAAAAT